MVATKDIDTMTQAEMDLALAEKLPELRHIHHACIGEFAQRGACLERGKAISIGQNRWLDCQGRGWVPHVTLERLFEEMAKAGFQFTLQGGPNYGILFFYLEEKQPISYVVGDILLTSVSRAALKALDGGLCTRRGECGKISPLLMVSGALLLLSVSLSSFVETFWAWLIIAVLALAATVVGAFAWRVEHEERGDRKRKEAHETDLRERPFHNTRWLASNARPLVPLDFSRPDAAGPEYREGDTLHLVEGDSNILIETISRVGDGIAYGNLRFIRQSNDEQTPTVREFQDMQPRGYTCAAEPDDDFGMRFWYKPPKPITEDKHLSSGPMFASSLN